VARQDFDDNGPMQQGIDPMEAVERLRRFKEELAMRERRHDMYRCVGGWLPLHGLRRTTGRCEHVYPMSSHAWHLGESWKTSRMMCGR
jgi:hypothetical protein